MNFAANSYRCLSAAALIAVLGLFPPIATAAPVDNIRLSRMAGITTVEIELGCAMRYLNHSPNDSGIEVQIDFSFGFDCMDALRRSPDGLYRPAGARMAKLSDVEFESISRTEGRMTLRFEQPVGFEVLQNANQYLLKVLVDPSIDIGGSGSTGTVAPAPKPAARPSVPTQSRAAPARRINPSEGKARNMFVLRLRDIDPSEQLDRAALQRIDTHVVYTNEIVVSGRSWLELRMGFFETEEEALSTLDIVRQSFPDAWVTIASPREQEFALSRRLPESEAPVAEAEPAVAATASRVEDAPTMGDDRVLSLMSEARTAIVREDYDRSIQIYTSVLEESASLHHPEARELLGVARLKNGQLAHAKAEFEAYLAEFPDNPDSSRVRQRLAALSRAPVASTAQSSARRPRVEVDDSGWDYHGGVSQFYLRGVNLTRDDEADVLAQSAVLSQADFSISRRGERFDLLARGNFAFMYEMEDKETENQGRVSYAYLDVIDHRWNLSGRFGRQTQHRGGVLGRFDGAQVNYDFWPNLTLKVNAGFPVDSPRFLPSANHRFYGGSIELTNMWDAWDFSVFTNQQTIDGIADRQAVGADVQYRSGPLQLIGLVDYDTSYAVLNNAMVAGTWRVFDRLTLSGRYQGGAGPYLTTRNAIMGQSVKTVESLFDTYTEGQIRRLARNRTAQVRSGSAGLSAELTERWHLNANVVYAERGSTVASGGVSAYPATKPQFDYGVNFLGSSILKTADSLNLGYRYRTTVKSNSNTFIVDLRYPVGEGLRINPRVAVTLKDNKRGPVVENREIKVDPRLRVVYRWRRKYRIEFEMGGAWTDEELPPALVAPNTQQDSISTSAYYLHLGYWMDFGR